MRWPSEPSTSPATRGTWGHSGKPRVLPLFGFPQYADRCAEVARSGYEGFRAWSADIEVAKGAQGRPGLTMSSVVSGPSSGGGDALVGPAHRLVSTLVLARLPGLPEDFGLVAMVSVLIGLADTLFDLVPASPGAEQIRRPGAFIHPGPWVIHPDRHAGRDGGRALRGRLFSRTAGEEPRHGDGAHLSLSAAANIGVVTFQKEMRFEREFQLFFAVRVFSFVVTLVAAWLMRSLLGTVIGHAGRSCLQRGALSYVMHPMRPRLSSGKIRRDLRFFSQWMPCAASCIFSTTACIGGGRQPRQKPRWSAPIRLLTRCASLPTTELLAPLNRVLFPAFVQVKDNLRNSSAPSCFRSPSRPRSAYPQAWGFALVANEAVPLLLGDKCWPRFRSCK